MCVCVRARVRMCVCICVCRVRVLCAQGLTQRDLFTITVLSDDLRRIPRKLSLSALTGRDTGRVHIAPVLKPLEVPVRAMILPLLDRAAAKHIGKLVRTHGIARHCPPAAYLAGDGLSAQP